MTTATLTALRESIEHHERARDDRRREVLGHATCSLCQMFWVWTEMGGRKFGCNGCPVKERTGQDFCIGSPYYPFGEDGLDLGELRVDGAIPDEQWRQLEQVEIDFLKSLLPEGEEA